MIELGCVMARWREEVRNIQLEHQQEHRDLEEVQNYSRTRRFGGWRWRQSASVGRGLEHHIIRIYELTVFL
jgi:hypothetical protein